MLMILKLVDELVRKQELVVMLEPVSKVEVVVQKLELVAMQELVAVTLELVARVEVVFRKLELVAMQELAVAMLAGAGIYGTAGRVFVMIARKDLVKQAV